MGKKSTMMTPFHKLDEDPLSLVGLQLTLSGSWLEWDNVPDNPQSESEPGLEATQTLEKVLQGDRPASQKCMQILHPDSQLPYHGTLMPSGPCMLDLLQGNSQLQTNAL